MAYADMNRTATAVAPTLSFAHLFSGLRAWHKANATRRALAKLSPRELDDIGLSFADIDAVAQRGIGRF